MDEVQHLYEPGSPTYECGLKAIIGFWPFPKRHAKQWINRIIARFYQTPRAFPGLNFCPDCVEATGWGIGVDKN